MKTGDKQWVVNLESGNIQETKINKVGVNSYNLKGYRFGFSKKDNLMNIPNNLTVLYPPLQCYCMEVDAKLRSERIKAINYIKNNIYNIDRLGLNDLSTIKSLI